MRFDGRTVELVELLDSWLAPDHRYFKMKDVAGATYILRHDQPDSRWKLTLYEAPPLPAGGKRQTAITPDIRSLLPAGPGAARRRQGA